MFPDVLIVSTFPRGTTSAATGLVSLDPVSLDQYEYRPFAPEEFLRNPATGEPTALRHGRGLHIEGDRLFAALFNAVNEYRIVDPATLELAHVERFVHAAAADLHGIDVRNDRLVAASTGTSSVLSWDLASGRAECLTYGKPEVLAPDPRFPEQSGTKSQGGRRWRAATTTHVNDVSISMSGDLVVCALSEVRLTRTASGTTSTLFQDACARFHDARLIDEDNALVMTNGGSGELVVVDLRDRRIRRTAVADPGRWFIRGLHLDGDFAYVLGSEITPNLQLAISDESDPSQERRGARFLVTVVDLPKGRCVASKIIALDSAPAGSAVYSIVRAASQLRCGHAFELASYAW